jgi:hypothetical protein
MKSKREEARLKRQRQKNLRKLSFIFAGVAVLAVLVYAFTLGVRPAVGEEVEIMADFSHVPEGTDPGPYNTNPPTSGKHYPNSYPAGFYEEADPDVAYPEGFLVHSLEHGYIIFWYNCNLLSDEACTQLKTDIRGVMDRAGNFKVIAHPWDSLEIPLVLTSWGRLLNMENFDSNKAYDFVVRNRNKAPEPNAP